MANMLFANNCNTTLNGGITAVATSMVVTSATGFPSPTGSQYFYCTLADAATQTTIEIVKVTAVSGTTFTIVRGQDGTTGTIFASGAVVSLRLVAASLNDFPKLDEANTFTQAQTFSTPIAVGSGGTGLTTLIAGYIPYGNGTSAFASSANLTFTGSFLSLLGTSAFGASAVRRSDFYFESANRALTATTANLAIGTSTAYGTDVGGQIALSGHYDSSADVLPFGVIKGAKENAISGNYAGYLAFGTSQGGAGFAEAMRISSTQGVSIGNTTDPGAGNLSVTGYASAASFRPTSSTVPTNGMFLPLANTLAWAINSAEAMRLNANGRLIIGGTAILGPGKANIYFDGATEDGIDLKNTNAGNAGAFLGFFNSAGGVAGSVSQNGSVGVLYNITSDRRLKSNIEPLKNSGAIIDALLPRTFTWTDDGSDDMGFITDEYQTVFKNAVTGTPNEVDDEGNPIYQQGDFSTSAQIAVLVAEIQSLRARLKAANIA